MFVYPSIRLLFGSMIIIFDMIIINNCPPPRWTQNDSLIGVNPGLGMKPGMSEERVDSSLYLLAAASEDFVPTNEKGEGDKNADFAVRLKSFYGNYVYAK